MRRLLKAWLAVATPLVCLAADDPRPACSSQTQGQMWPAAANHDPKLMKRLIQCGELFICVHGAWRYHWESPSVRLDQLLHHGKSKSAEPAVCHAEALAGTPMSDRATPEKGAE